MYKNIVFDVDGTLINTEESIIRALQDVLLSEKGTLYTPEDLEFVLGVPGVYSIEKFNLENPDLALADWEVKMKSYAHYNSIYDGIFKLISALKDLDVNLGIVTSRRDSECDHDLHFNMLKEEFDFIVTADRTVKHKPEADPLLYYLENTNALAGDTLYIGDTPYDSSCAKGANVDFMLAGWGAKNAESIQCKDILSHPYDILKYVTR